MNWPGSTNRGTALLKYLHQRDRPLLVRDDYVEWFVDGAAGGEPPKPPGEHDDHGSQMDFNAYCYTVVRERFLDDLIERAV